MIAPADQVRARFYEALADPSRLALLAVLKRDREICASEAASLVGLTQSNASRHLACLRDRGLVEARQTWRHVHYRLAEGVDELLDLNDRFIERATVQVEGERP